MSNKIQYEAVVIHESLQEMIRQKQICLHDVPNFLLDTSSHCLIFLLLKTSKKLISIILACTIDGYEKEHRAKH